MSEQSIDSVFGNNISKINAALSSNYGKQEINKTYQDEIQTKAAKMDKIVESMQNPAAKSFYRENLSYLESDNYLEPIITLKNIEETPNSNISFC